MKIKHANFFHSLTTGAANLSLTATCKWWRWLTCIRS